MSGAIEAKALKERKGISGSTLKWIAIVTMLIDHIGAIVIADKLMEAGVDLMSMYAHTQLDADLKLLMSVYTAMRAIGRIAFPIFCFLLVEGFVHTHDVKKYSLRLFIFALISEIPFDLALYKQIFYGGLNNVFFTLLIGVLVMLGIQKIEAQGHWQADLKGLLKIGVVLLGMGAAILGDTDYSWIGVLCITLLYMTRDQKIKQIIVGCISFAYEIVAPLAFIPIAFYNGKRGMNMKYFFYIFYPAHLLLLYLVTVWI